MNVNVHLNSADESNVESQGGVKTMEPDLEAILKQIIRGDQANARVE